jgi:hypothetical protein
MTMEMAKDAVNWLESVGCRVLAYMGGEPLVRKDFIVELTRYFLFVSVAGETCLFQRLRHFLIQQG